MAEGIERDALRRLGRGDRLDDVARDAGLDRDGLRAAWRAETRRRLPDYDGERAGAATRGIGGRVEILRDDRGVPHVYAESDADLFFGYGYAMAQDRLFQMDLRRRRGHGRLAEVLGAEAVEADVLARTMDLAGLSRTELERLAPETRALLDAFAAGVNALATETADRPPIEFDLLGYRPEPWTALDSVVCAASWRWQLTGRPWVISVPEFVARTLGDGPLSEAFLAFAREPDDTSILPAGSYPTSRSGALPAAMGAGAAARAGLAGAAAGGAGRGAASAPEGGSNNWAVAGARSVSGGAMVASDPHMPYEAASSFYEIHLSGGSFQAAGAGFVGLPGLTFGRNRHLAWGITNNICSLRDLYVERGSGAVIGERTETIAVGGGEPVSLTVQETRHGPIIDRLLPPAAAPDGPVAMRWVGQLDCDWIAAQFRLSRAGSIEDAFDAIRGWLAPTFSLVMGDDRGRIAYHATGAVPIRERAERGFRDGDDAADDWTGLIPPEGMPRVIDPPRGWLATANNRPAPDDFPYPLSGTWDEDHRARRVGELIRATERHDRVTFARIHGDVLSVRARLGAGHLVAALRGRMSPDDEAALAILAAWDAHTRADSAAAAIWEVAFTRWTQAVAAERLPAGSADFVATFSSGLARRLLAGDEAGWFASDARRLEVLAATVHGALEELRAALGPDPATWRWGDLHRWGPRHPLSGRGDLGQLLDRSTVPIGGDGATVQNTAVPGGRIPATSPDYWRNWEAAGGAGYRLFADLGDPSGSLWTITGEGQSAHPGSPHADDQVEDFVSARYRELPLDRGRVEAATRHRLVLRP